MYIKVNRGETAAEIALRAGCPLCMLLRANGVISGVWLEMMDEVRVPDKDECEKSAFPCPKDVSFAKIPERTGCIVRAGDTAKSIAAEYHLPERILLKENHLSEGNGIYLPLFKKDMIIHTVKPMETWKDFENSATLKLINNHFAPLYPGMKILIKG